VNGENIATNTARAFVFGRGRLCRGYALAFWHAFILPYTAAAVVARSHDRMMVPTGKVQNTRGG
jgi:hypothetical protein